MISSRITRGIVAEMSVGGAGAGGPSLPEPPSLTSPLRSVSLPLPPDCRSNPAPPSSDVVAAVAVQLVGSVAAVEVVVAAAPEQDIVAAPTAQHVVARTALEPVGPAVPTTTWDPERPTAGAWTSL